MEVLQHISIVDLVDIAFAILVSLLCLRTIFGGSQEKDQYRSQWKDDLSELEFSLRALIAEAGMASSSLDADLLERKKELEHVLLRLENKEKELMRKLELKQSDARHLIRNDDLPNETWLVDRDLPPKQSLTSQLLASLREDNGLEQVVERTQDTVSLSTSRLVEPHTSPAIANSSEFSTLDEIYRKTSILDKATFAIAVRMLRHGSELHVVARKLELPVSEIRALDGMLRRADGVSVEQVVSHQEPEEIIRPMKSIHGGITKEWVEPQQQSQGFDTEQGMENSIEREIAFL